MRTINRLSAAQVARTHKVGRFGDGGGLYLQVSQFGTKAWLFRFMLDGKARQMGLGSVDTFSLKEARERARAARQLVADGVDPIDARNEKRSAIRVEDAKRVTFAEAADRYISAHAAGWRNATHAIQWQKTLATYAAPVIGDLPVALVDTSHVMRIIEPIWAEKTVTASRIRGRVESVLDWAKARHYRCGDNPARWRGHLDHLLPATAKVAKVEHLAAMPYTELPAFMARLRAARGVAAAALEFTILAATRTNETLGATWDEINLDSRTWTIPAERTKARREHRVPLSDRAIAILAALPREAGNPHVFVGGKQGGGLSHTALLQFLRSMDGVSDVTVHGFRNTFRDWVGERTNFPREVAEAALAHVVGDSTEAAYRRGDALEKRRRLMTAWEKYCAEKPAVKADNVVAMQAKA